MLGPVPSKEGIVLASKMGLAIKSGWHLEKASIDYREKYYIPLPKVFMWIDPPEEGAGNPSFKVENPHLAPVFTAPQDLYKNTRLKAHEWAAVHIF